MPGSYFDAYYGGNTAVYVFFWGNGKVDATKDRTVYRQIQDSLNPFYNNSSNWWKYAFRTGKILNANIQASGGTERVKYMVGAGWYNEKGINVGSDFSRVNLLSNLNMTPRKNLTMDVRLSLSYTDMSMGGGGLDNKKIAYMTVNPKGLLLYYLVPVRLMT